MSNQISLTIPSDDEKALVAGATFLLTLAGKVPNLELEDHQGCDCDRDMSHIEAKIPVEQGGTMFTPEELEPVIPNPPVAEPNLAEQVMGAAPVIVDTNVLTDGFTNPPEVQASTTPSVEVDPDGLPWDARIHSGNKTKNKDGRWKKKKGIDKEDIERIEAELRQVMSAGAPVAQSPVAQPPVTQSPVAQPPVTQSPVAQPPVTQSPVTDGGTPANFTEFLKACSGLMQSGKLSMPRINETLTGYGLPNGMRDVQNREDLIPELWSALMALVNNA